MIGIMGLSLWALLVAVILLFLRGASMVSNDPEEITEEDINPYNKQLSPKN